MAHLGKVTIATWNKFKKLSEISNIVLEDGKTYILQICNPAYVISSSVEPTDGGFYINNPQIFTYTKVGGEDLWLKSNYAILNIAE